MKRIPRIQSGWWRLALSLILLSVIATACVFNPVQDTRTPADATATNVALDAVATATQVVIEATLEATPAPECLIKGNINRRGERIYHVEGGASYARTIVDPESGEAWFCTPEDAEAAGYRAARN